MFQTIMCMCIFVWILIAVSRAVFRVHAKFHDRLFFLQEAEPVKTPKKKKKKKHKSDADSG